MWDLLQCNKKFDHNVIRSLITLIFQPWYCVLKASHSEGKVILLWLWAVTFKWWLNTWLPLKHSCSHQHWLTGCTCVCACYSFPQRGNSDHAVAYFHPQHRLCCAHRVTAQSRTVALLLVPRGFSYSSGFMLFKLLLRISRLMPGCNTFTFIIILFTPFLFRLLPFKCSLTCLSLTIFFYLMCLLACS